MGATSDVPVEVHGRQRYTRALVTIQLSSPLELLGNNSPSTTGSSEAPHARRVALAPPDMPKPGTNNSSTTDPASGFCRPDEAALPPKPHDRSRLMTEMTLLA